MSACPVSSRSGLQSGLPTIVGIPAESQPSALRGLESDELLRRLGMVHACECASTAEVLVHLIEVQRRKLFQSTACSCLYVYCQRKLHMSKAEAFRRTTAVRLGRRHPVILQAIADGRLNLTAVALLSPHLKGEHVDVDEIVSAFAYKTIRETQQLLAERFPRQDAPTVMRVLVSAVAANKGGVAAASGLDGVGSEAFGSAAGPGFVTELFSRRVDTTDSRASTESVGPLRDDAANSGAAIQATVAGAATQLASRIAAKLGEQLGESGEQGAAEAPVVASQAILQAVTQVLEQAVANDPNSAEAIELRAKFTPLSPGRHCWQLTVDQEAQDLMDEALNYVELGSNAPHEALKQSLRCFVEQRRKRKFAQVSKPRAQSVEPSTCAPRHEVSNEAPQSESQQDTAAVRMKPGAIEGGEGAPDQRADASRRASSSHTRPNPREPRSRHIPAEVRRAVYTRDGGRCTFESADGTRCEERRDMQFDHRIPFASGGESTVDNVRTLCGEHNRHEAERAFGAEHVQERIRAGQRERERAKAR